MTVRELASWVDARMSEWEAWPANERMTRPGIAYYLAQKLDEAGICWHVGES